MLSDVVVCVSSLRALYLWLAHGSFRPSWCSAYLTFVPKRARDQMNLYTLGKTTR